VVEYLLKHDSDYDIYYRIIDVSRLADISANDWDAIIILHTWEIWKPEPNTERFIKKQYDQNKIFILSTSGSGDNKIEGTDGITSASDLTQTTIDSKKIAKWLHQTLSKKFI